MFVKTMLASFLCSLSLHALDRVKIDVTSKVDKNQMTVNFKVASIDTLKLNLTAPWSLKLADAKVFDKADYTMKDFNSDLPGFVVVSKDASKLSSLKYELTAFSCTKDGLQCFRDVLKGEYPLKTAGKKK